MSLRTTCFRVFLGLRREEPTTKNSSSSSSSSRSSIGSCACRDTKNLATPKPWPRSTPKTTETGDASRGRLCSDDQNRPLLFLVRMLCWQLALFSVSFSIRGVVTSFRLHLFTCTLLTTALCVSRIRRKALICLQAAGSIAATNCAVRCAHCSVLVVVHAACLCCSFFSS